MRTTEEPLTWFGEKVSGIFKVIKNMYENIKSCGMLQQHLSDVFMCNKGIRQGENLAPLLFNFFVNIIEEQ